MDYWIGMVVVAVAAAFVSFILAVVYLEPKWECEANLPRNVECVWAPPTDNGEGGQ